MSLLESTRENVDKNKVKQLKKQANEMAAKFNLGRNGITETFIDSLDKYLEAHEIVKIKSSIAANRDELMRYAEQVAQQTKSTIIEAKGYTFVLYREKE